MTYPFRVVFIDFKVCFGIDLFAKTIQSDYLISAIFKFLMKSLFTGGVGSLSELFLELISYINLFKIARFLRF